MTEHSKFLFKEFEDDTFGNFFFYLQEKKIIFCQLITFFIIVVLLLSMMFALRRVRIAIGQVIAKLSILNKFFEKLWLAHYLAFVSQLLEIHSNLYPNRACEPCHVFG